MMVAQNMHGTEKEKTTSYYPFMLLPAAKE